MPNALGHIKKEKIIYRCACAIHNVDLELVRSKKEHVFSHISHCILTGYSSCPNAYEAAFLARTMQESRKASGIATMHISAWMCIACGAQMKQYSHV